MHADDVRALFDYSYAANQRILNAASRLCPRHFVMPPPFGGARSLQETLVHTLDTESGWRENLRQGRANATPILDPAEFPDIATLAHAWRDDALVMRDWLATLDDDMVNGPAFNGIPLWQCLCHVVNHGTQHRSEAAMILTHFGASPGDMDLTLYLRGWT